MEYARFTDPALYVALALAAGTIAQSLARHMRIPGIVVLLAAGVLLGPDVLGAIRPEALGQTLHALVGFAVAVILFEGGMNLNLGRLRRQARSIRQLVTLGALVTLAGGTLAAHFILGWSWTPAFLFGSLVIVTGPTVITPLLRRIKVRRQIATVLEAEGILVDAIGAIFAAVALQVAVSPSGEAMAFAVWDLAVRIGFGVLLGLAGGLAIAFLLRREKIVPEGLENVFTLALVFALFQVSNAIFAESGIVTVTMAGLAVGNVRTRALPELLEFKEQLTVMLIGMLFVLLAADVRIDEVRSLGRAGIWTVAALMFVVRPLNVLIGTFGSDLGPREKLFLCWLAPRGIVAAAGASLFAETLTREGVGIGHELRAMVFLVIAVTVLVQGLTGGLVARLLAVRRPSNSGYAILGANHLGRAFGRVLQDAGQEVVLLESNADAFRGAQSEGFRVLFGSGLNESLLARAEVDARAGCLALTPNEAVNMLFARRTLEEFKVPQVWVTLRRGYESVGSEMVHEAGARVLFGEPRFVDLWTLRLERNIARVERWERVRGESADEAEMQELRDLHKALLPLAVRRGKKVHPMDEESSFKKQDQLYVVIFDEKREQGCDWLRAHGWEPAAVLTAERAAADPPAAKRPSRRHTPR
ncbi:MAG: cation:proton antiporter [Candidatus Krumholzibacteriia bacterium]